MVAPQKKRPGFYPIPENGSPYANVVNPKTGGNTFYGGATTDVRQGEMREREQTATGGGFLPELARSYSDAFGKVGNVFSRGSNIAGARFNVAMGPESQSVANTGMLPQTPQAGQTQAAPQAPQMQPSVGVPPLLQRPAMLPMSQSPLMPTLPSMPTMGQPVQIPMRPSGVMGATPQNVLQGVQNLQNTQQVQNQATAARQDMAMPQVNPLNVAAQNGLAASVAGLAADRAARMQAVTNPGMALPMGAPVDAGMLQNQATLQQGRLPSGLTINSVNPGVLPSQAADMGLNVNYTSAVPTPQVGRIARGVDSIFGNAGMDRQAGPAVSADVVAKARQDAGLNDPSGQNRNYTAKANPNNAELKANLAERRANVTDYNKNRRRGDSPQSYNQRQDAIANAPQNVMARENERNRKNRLDVANVEAQGQRDAAQARGQGQVGAAEARRPNNTGNYRDQLVEAIGRAASSSTTDPEVIAYLKTELAAENERLAKMPMGERGSAGPAPVPNSQAEAVVGQAYTLRDGRIGVWDGQRFNIQKS